MEGKTMFGKNKGKKEPNPGKIGIGRFWAWGSREFSETANVLILLQITYYCVNTLHLDPLILATLMAVSKLVDGVTDVFAGYIVDKTHSRLGKGRPYELCVIGTWVCTYLMFAASPEWADITKYIWVLSMYILVCAVFNTLLNAGENVYMVRSFNGKQIVRLNSYIGIVSSVAGLVVNIFLPQLISRYQNEIGGWQKIVMFIGIPLGIIAFMRFIFIRETYNLDHVETEKGEGVKLKDVFAVMRNNGYMWILVISIFVSQLGSQLGLGSFYFESVLGDIGLSSFVSFIAILALPAVFIFPRLISKWNVKTVVIFGTISCIFGDIICFVSNTNLILYMVGYLFIGLGALPGTYLIRLMSYDCAAYNEWKGMPRMDGTIGAIQGFAKRVGSAASAWVGGLMLSLIGYSGAAAASASTLLGLRVCTTLFPAVISVLGIVILCFYKLDEKMPQINADNEKKRAAAVQKEA